MHASLPEFQEEYPSNGHHYNQIAESIVQQ